MKTEQPKAGGDAAKEQAGCGGPGDAIGGAFVALATNVGVGLLTGLLTAASLAARPGATREEIASAARRGLVLGSSLHGAIVGGVGLASAKKHPYFAGAAVYTGLTSLAAAAVVAMLPDAALAPPATPAVGYVPGPGVVRDDITSGPAPSERPAVGLTMECPFKRAIGLGTAPRVVGGVRGFGVQVARPTY